MSVHSKPTMPHHLITSLIQHRQGQQQSQQYASNALRQLYIHAVRATHPTTTSHQPNRASHSYMLQVSKILGYTVSIGSFASKIPQILKIYKHKNVDGLSLSMFGIEVLTQSVNILFHYSKQYPVSTYGENISFLLSNLCILILYYYYTRNYKAVLWLTIPSLLLPLLHYPHILKLLQSAAIPLYIISRVPQIYSNYKHQSTGQLSAITFTSNFIGSCIRILTTATQLGNDPLLQSAFTVSCICNATLLAQIYMYQKQSHKSGKARVRFEKNA